MKCKLPVIFLTFFVPLYLGWGVARAADQADIGGFKVALTDGGQMSGAVSFEINLDTEYGQIHIPSSSLVSAQFDQAQSWADIQMNSAHLKMKYKAASSDLKATVSSAGPLTIGLTKVVRIDRGGVAQGLASVPAPANVPATLPTYDAQPAPVPVSPPAVVYPYSTPYQYVAPYDYGYAPYDYYGPYVGWPYWGIGISVGPGFGFRGGFHGGFHGAFGHGGGFHGGFGHGGRR